MQHQILLEEDIPGVTRGEKKMFNVNVSQLGSVVVKTSDQGGLSNEQIADLAVEKIASVSEDAPHI